MLATYHYAAVCPARLHPFIKITEGQSQMDDTSHRLQLMEPGGPVFPVDGLPECQTVVPGIPPKQQWRSFLLFIGLVLAVLVHALTRLCIHRSQANAAGTSAL
jgi:hypothetical protein